MQKVNMSLLPPSLLARYLALPRTIAEIDNMCEHCGNTVEVKEITIKDEVRYSLVKCTCRIAEEKRLEQEQIRKAMLDTASRHTYTWLGGRWTDVALREKTFETFDQSKQLAAYESARMFANDPYGVLVLHGTYGTGKTHLLAAICNTALRNKKPVKSLFTTSPKMFAAIQERIQRNEEYYPIIDKAIQTPLLVIDDIDKAKYSEFREEIYFSIVDDRIKAGMPIAVSTNRLSELASFVGGAVCSRLKTGQIEVEMAGDDYREEM